MIVVGERETDMTSSLLTSSIQPLFKQVSQPGTTFISCDSLEPKSLSLMFILKMCELTTITITIKNAVNKVGMCFFC